MRLDVAPFVGQILLHLGHLMVADLFGGLCQPLRIALLLFLIFAAGMIRSDKLLADHLPALFQRLVLDPLLAGRVLPIFKSACSRCRPSMSGSMA